MGLRAQSQSADIVPIGEVLWTKHYFNAFVQGQTVDITSV